METSRDSRTILTRNVIAQLVASGCTRFSEGLLPAMLFLGALALGVLATVRVVAANPPPADDQKIIASLDTQYQAAVKRNDSDTMGRLLADDFVLVIGSGKTHTKSDLLKEARSGRVHYEQQDDTDQTVRVWGDTAVITAKLWVKGTDGGKPFDYMLWFSDTYVRTPSGWRYVFGQASLPLPKHQ